jgi:hypothetical protein
MKPKTQSRLPAPLRAPLALASLCVLALAFSGCPKGPVTPKFVQTGVTRVPNAPNVADQSAPPDLDAEPSEAANAPLTVVFEIPPERPPAPHHSSPPAETEASKPPDAPQLSPALSPEDQARAQSDVNDGLQTARQNLASVSARRMNATQQDIADKVRSFMEQTRDAVNVGDWNRARNLAEKARVLSIELVHSF